MWISLPHLEIRFLSLAFNPIVCYNFNFWEADIRPSFIMLSIIFSFLLLPFLHKADLLVQPSAQSLAVREFSLETRYNDTFVNSVFKENILLTVRYLSGERIDPKNINWDGIKKPFEYKLVLRPGETFAFHDDVLPEFEGKVSKTTNAHFNGQDGFKSDGYLMGDGVCHLASLLYWVARDAGLDAIARVNHNFANIPEVPKEYGVSIYAYPGKQAGDQMQNLYITNNRGKVIAFEFNYDGKNLKIQAVENLN